VKIALAQINTTVGDFEGNVEKILRVAAEAKGADLIVYPELALSGYPARDLLNRKDFLAKSENALQALASRVTEPALLVGWIEPQRSAEGKPAFNAAALLADRRIRGNYRKKLLPTYDVFDEGRYFEASPEAAVPMEFGGIRLGVTICEDAWNEARFWPHRIYHRDPIEECAEGGANLLVNISASPFHERKREFRRAMLRSHALHHRLPLLYVNLIGGNDELIFDGESYAFDGGGGLAAAAKTFEEGWMMVDFRDGVLRPVGGHLTVEVEESDVAEIYDALVLGTRDYVRKTGFRSVVLGLSGGIDSAITATIARDALGASNVLGVLMPSRYSSEGSREDAEALARNLGIDHVTISIEPAYEATLQSLRLVFGSRPADTTEENLQARIRANLLMALSNKLGHLVLTTGNKSELAVGYCTLYGDMAGGLAVISDVPKTTIYQLAQHVNRDGEVIPRRTIEKPPSAELKPDQKDQDTLPPYALLDRVLTLYVEEERSREEILTHGIDPAVVDRILQLVNRSEYKRRQAAPGLKISPRAFGPGRRVPIAMKWGWV
jgi:NAD+ synthetase